LAARHGALAADLDAAGAWLDRHGRLLAALCGVATAAAALVFATYSASGADASGYLSQAAMWSRLGARVEDPLVLLPGWPLTPGDTAPLGWRPALEPGWQVPTYAPGLPWLMAVPHAIAGTAGATWVIAAAAGLAVWASGALAGRWGGGFGALIAAPLVATSPTFLYQSFQPMSDVPVTAAWVTCWWLIAERRVAGAGVAAALAVLVRPNLAPLALLPWLAVILRAPRGAAWPPAWRFALPVALAGAAIALVQSRWYGSPSTSGYGSASELFDLANLVPNARLYTSWLREAEPAFLWTAAAAVLAWLWQRWGAHRRRHREGTPGNRTRERDAAGIHLVFAAGVTLAYLVYAQFEVWSYLRFLLPAMAVVAALAAAALARSARRLPPAARAPATLVLVAAISAAGLATGRSLGVFEVAEVSARAREMGERLALTLPPRAVLLAGEQSGSMRYATGRPIVRWESLDAVTLGAALRVLEAYGYEPWWVLDQFEEAGVRSRFAGLPEAALDARPDVEAGPRMRTRAWRIRSVVRADDRR
jgi:hypothetical protein